MAINYDQINVYVRTLIKPRLISSYITIRPLLYFIAGASATNLDKLGDPRMSVVLGGKNLGAAQRQTLNGSYNHQWRYQKQKTDPAVAITDANSTGKSSGFADDNVGIAETRWNHFWSPLKVRQSRLDAAMSDLRVASIMEEAVGEGFQSQLDYAQSQLWAGTLTQNQQDQEEWANFLGVTQAVSDGVSSGQTGYQFYGRTDRSLWPQLRANVVTAANLATDGYITGTVPSLEMIRALKTVNTGPVSAAAYNGIANKNAKAGRLAITTPELWNVLATQAENKHRIIDPGTKSPEFLTDIGLEYPMILKDTTYITYDPLCPTGEFYLLSPDWWMFEIQGGSNFKVEPWQKKWVNEEGGGYYSWTNIHAKTRLTCEAPFLQTKVTGLTTV